MLNATLQIERASRYEGAFGSVQDDFPVVVLSGLSPRRPRKPVGYEPHVIEEHFPMPEAADSMGESTLSYRGDSMHLLEFAGDVALASML